MVDGKKRGVDMESGASPASKRMHTGKTAPLLISFCVACESLIK